MSKVKRILTLPLRHKWKSFIVLIIAGVLLYFFYPKPPPPVETVKVAPETIIESVTASGKVASETSVTLNFLAGGKLVYVGAKEGDMVNQWQTIAALDQRSMQKNIEQALRDYAKQRNAFDQTQEKYQNRKPSEALNDEMKRILENNQYDLDRAINSYEVQRLSTEQSYLASPIRGMLIRADAQTPGVNVTPATTYIVADPEKLTFTIEVDEGDIGKVSIGQSVEVTLDAFPTIKMPLEVSSIDFSSHLSESGGNVYDVKTFLPYNSDYKYRIGMSGDAEIILAKKTNVLSIPLSSLTTDNYVYVKTTSGFEKRKVKTGLQSDTAIEIKSGLKDGDEIALQPEDAEKTLINKK